MSSEASINLQQVFLASKTFVKHKSYDEAEDVLKMLLLRSLHEDQQALAGTDEALSEFRCEELLPCVLALIEIQSIRDEKVAMKLLEDIVEARGHFSPFWHGLPLSRKAIFYDWHGQIAFAEGETEAATTSLRQAASLGRDSFLLWRILGELNLEPGNYDLAIRYLKRSLELYRQVELNLHSGKEFELGFFSESNVLGWAFDEESYLQLFLKVTKLGRHSKAHLKKARELLVEMIHQFPDDDRLMKVRIMLEKSITSFDSNY